ncbi:MAG: hypothetical protein WBB45_22635 [Cyclobacteriaceae bacterium]
MMKKKELTLSDLRIASFVTDSHTANTLRGGAPSGLSCPKELCKTDPIDCWEATLHTCTD